MPRGTGFIAALAVFALAMLALPGSAQVPPATVIGPVSQPAAAASVASASPTEAIGSLLSGWPLRILILAGATGAGWVIGSALRPRRASRPGGSSPSAPEATGGSSQGALQWALQPLRKYAVFKGRAPRREYWLFAVLVLAASILAAYVDAALGQVSSYGIGPLQGLLAALVFLPGLAVAVRRLHDSGNSGVTLLFILLPIIGGLVLLVFFLIPGTHGPNRYGPPPVPQDT